MGLESKESMMAHTLPQRLRRPVLPEGSVVVKTGSHRARHRLNQLAGHKLLEVIESVPTKKFFQHYTVLPVELLPQALKIPMVTRGKPKGELARCW